MQAKQNAISSFLSRETQAEAAAGRVRSGAATPLVFGGAPQDSADPFAGQLAGKTSGDPVAERYMGGGFCGMDYSRGSPAPAKLFG